MTLTKKIGFATTFAMTTLAACAQTPPPTPTPLTVGSSHPGPTAAESPVNFVGHWQVHGAVMDIAATTATIVVNAGPCSQPAHGMCHETDTLTVSPSADEAMLTLVVTDVSYADDTGSSVAHPDPTSATAVGDSMRLVAEARGLLKASVLHGFPGWVGGNPYWCGADVNEPDRQRCGA
jgi:hypothetical protein